MAAGASQLLVGRPAADHNLTTTTPATESAAGAGDLTLSILLGMADAAPLVHRGTESSTGICHSSGSHDATAAAISRRVLRWVQRRAPEPRVWRSGWMTRTWGSTAT